MISQIVSISVIAVIGGVLALMLKRDRPEYSLLISVCAGVIILLSIITAAKDMTYSLMEISSLAGINSDYMVVIIKSCVVAMITGVTASTCRDCGYSSLGLKLEIVGRITIIILAMPVINKLLSIILSVIR